MVVQATREGALTRCHGFATAPRAQVRPMLEAAHKVSRARADAAAVVVGSRAHISGPHAAKRSLLRRVLGGAFQALLGALGGGARATSGAPIRDTQCGFKAFSRHAAQLLFPALHVERWAFDVELLQLAERRHIPIVVREGGRRVGWFHDSRLLWLPSPHPRPQQEVPVAWHEVDGSQVGLVSASLQMARDVLAMRLCYGLGLWTDALPPAYLAASIKRGVHPSGATVSRFEAAREMGVRKSAALAHLGGGGSGSHHAGSSSSSGAAGGGTAHEAAVAATAGLLQHLGHQTAVPKHDAAPHAAEAAAAAPGAAAAATGSGPSDAPARASGHANSDSAPPPHPPSSAQHHDAPALPPSSAQHHDPAAFAAAAKAARAAEAHHRARPGVPPALKDAMYRSQQGGGGGSAAAQAALAEEGLRVRRTPEERIAEAASAHVKRAPFAGGRRPAPRVPGMP